MLKVFFSDFGVFILTVLLADVSYCLSVKVISLMS